MLDLARARWLYERKANTTAPTAIVLKTTRACNLRCTYCYSDGGSDSKVLPLDLAVRMVDEVSALNGLPFSVYLHGGEPLLCEDFLVGFLSIMSTRDYYLRVRVGIQTNGTLITQRWAEFFRRWRIGVGVSLDGISHETNRFRTSPTKENSLDRVVGGLDILRKNGIPVGLLTVVTNENVTHLLEILEFEEIAPYVPERREDDGSGIWTYGEQAPTYTGIERKRRVVAYPPPIVSSSEDFRAVFMNYGSGLLVVTGAGISVAAGIWSMDDLYRVLYLRSLREAVQTVTERPHQLLQRFCLFVIQLYCREPTAAH